MKKEVSTPGPVCSSPLAQAEQELSQCWVIGGVAPFCTISLRRSRGYAQTKKE